MTLKDYPDESALHDLYVEVSQRNDSDQERREASAYHYNDLEADRGCAEEILDDLGDV